MKVLSIKQPWATLIANGYKEYEFRTWKTNYRGPILIHASKSIDNKAIYRFKDYNLDYPTGCIIASCNITDCIKVDDDLRKKLLKKDNKVYHNLEDKKWNGYGFKIENVKKTKQVKINGKLGLWNYNI